VLLAVLSINGALFLIELSAGLAAHSTALLADSADMLGDAIVYGFSLYVVGPESDGRLAAPS
jgi:Co/Zn/Cd efflux system component